MVLYILYRIGYFLVILLPLKLAYRLASFVADICYLAHPKDKEAIVKNFETILIGKLSSKSIVRKNGKLNKITKRIALSLKFYEFTKRLKYKCNVNNINIGIIDEWMTSKMCSFCGTIDEKLGSKKIYKCKNCKKVLDRDINGARNIYMKAIL